MGKKIQQRVGPRWSPTRVLMRRYHACIWLSGVFPKITNTSSRYQDFRYSLREGGGMDTEITGDACTIRSGEDMMRVREDSAFVNDS